MEIHVIGTQTLPEHGVQQEWGPEVGMGPRELSLVGICNLSPSTKLVGNSKCPFTCPKISCPDFQHNGMRRRS